MGTVRGCGGGEGIGFSTTGGGIRISFQGGGKLLCRSRGKDEAGDKYKKTAPKTLKKPHTIPIRYLLMLEVKKILAEAFQKEKNSCFFNKNIYIFAKRGANKKIACKQKGR